MGMLKQYLRRVCILGQLDFHHLGVKLSIASEILPILASPYHQRSLQKSGLIHWDIESMCSSTHSICSSKLHFKKVAFPTVLLASGNKNTFVSKITQKRPHPLSDSCTWTCRFPKKNTVRYGRQRREWLLSVERMGSGRWSLERRENGGTHWLWECMSHVGSTGGTLSAKTIACNHQWHNIIIVVSVRNNLEMTWSPWRFM